MKLIWEIQTNKGQTLTELLQKVADLCARQENIPQSTAVHVCLCDDAQIQEYNRMYRNIDRSTDVLSFPLISYPAGKTARDCPEKLAQVFDDEVHGAMIGDIVISMDHVFQQAEEFGHSAEREAAYLLVHGICHLMGYDHIEDAERKRMRMMEESVLCAAGVQRDHDVSDEKLLQLAREAMKNSYSPYSHFPVGAAILSVNGKIYTGCNIENASYGLTRCAEQVAVCKAVSEGERRFSVIAIAANRTAWPCGACRQILNEFAPDIRVLVTWDDHVEEANLRDLLPYGFGPSDLQV